MKTTPTLCICAAIVAFAGGFLNHDAEGASSYINGSISFRGSAYLNGLLGSATAITNYSGVLAIADTNGNYAPINNSSAVTWTPLTFAPTGTPVVPLWTTVSNGVTYSFDATSMTVVYSTTNFLTLLGSGIAHVTGYADTPGIWTVGAQQFSSSVSFTATTVISATNIPTIHSFLTNGNLGLSWNALPDQPYQLQTTSNATQTVWSNVTGVITTTNPTATASYPIKSEPGRLFRVVVLPQ
jgi:hypothetical protein